MTPTGPNPLEGLDPGEVTDIMDSYQAHLAVVQKLYQRSYGRNPRQVELPTVEQFAKDWAAENGDEDYISMHPPQIRKALQAQIDQEREQSAQVAETAAMADSRGMNYDDYLRLRGLPPLGDQTPMGVGQTNQVQGSPSSGSNEGALNFDVVWDRNPDGSLRMRKVNQHRGDKTLPDDQPTQRAGRLDLTVKKRR